MDRWIKKSLMIWITDNSNQPQTATDLIYHSDCAVSFSYQMLLKQHDMIASMSCKGKLLV